MDTLALNLTADELCSVVQGLRASICSRLWWMMSPSHPIRTCEFDDEMKVLDDMTQAYSRAMMLAKESEAIVDEFKEYFMLSEHVWSMLDVIAKAATWDEVPVHKHSPLTCPLCEELITAV